MNEDRTDRCCWWYIALLVACTLAIVGVMLVVQLLEADHDEPAPEPAPETVETETQAEASEVALPAEPSQAVSPVAPEPAYQAAAVYRVPSDRLMNEDGTPYHFVDAPGSYLGWRFMARPSYDNCLIPSGREVYYDGTTDHPSSEAYMVDALRAYTAYKVQTWVRLRGFPASPLCDEEYALAFVCYLEERGRDVGTALSICEVESTFMLAAGSNDFGIKDPRFQPGTLEDYCDYLDAWCGARNDLPWVMAHYNEHPDWHRNVSDLKYGFDGERY